MAMTYMIVVVVSLTMETRKMALEKIVFGTTNKKKEIPHNHDHINRAVETHGHDNIAVDCEVCPGEETIVPHESNIAAQTHM